MIERCVLEPSLKYLVRFMDYGMKSYVDRDEIDTRRFGMTTPPMAVSFRLEGEIGDRLDVIDSFFEKLAEEIVEVRILPLGVHSIAMGPTFVDRYEDLAVALRRVSADTMVNKFYIPFFETMLTT